MEILIRQSMKLSIQELQDALDCLASKYDRLSIESRQKVNKFSTPEEFRARIKVVNTDNRS